MTSTAVTEGLQAVLAAIQKARSAGRIDSLDAGQLRSNIERYYHQKQIGGGALRSYARQIARMAKVPVAAVAPWDHVYRSFPHENWRLVVEVLRDGDIVQLVYRDGWHERFEKGVELVRIGYSSEDESALHDLAGDPGEGGVFDVAVCVRPGDTLRHSEPRVGPVFAVGYALGVLRQEGAPGAVALIWERDGREWRRRFAFTKTSRGTVVAIHPSASGIAKQPGLDTHEVFLQDPNEPEHLIKHGVGVHTTGDGRYIVERSGQRWLVRPAAPARAAEARKVGTLKAAGDAIRAMREDAQEGVVQARPRADGTRGRRHMTKNEEADARGETELSDEATTPEQKAEWEAEGGRADGWYILTLDPDKTTTDDGEGPWDTKADALEFAEAEFGVPWVLFRAPLGTVDAFEAERERVYHDRPDDRTDWYVLKVGPNKVATVVPGGPSASMQGAEDFAKRKKVTGKWIAFLAPAGTAKAFKEEQHAKQAATSARTTARRVGPT
jgi:hypothetical protein